MGMGWNEECAVENTARPCYPSMLQEMNRAYAKLDTFAVNTAALHLTCAARPNFASALLCERGFSQCAGCRRQSFAHHATALRESCFGASMGMDMEQRKVVYRNSVCVL